MSKPPLTRRAFGARSLFSPAIVALLAACGAPRPADGPSQPQTAATAPVAAFPRSVTDATGSTLTIPRRPVRIVSATLATDEILLGDHRLPGLVDRSRIVAVTSLAPDSVWSNVTDTARGLPTVRSDPEPIIARQPDLVLFATWSNPDHVRLLKEVGLTVVVIHLSDTLDQIHGNIRAVAKVVGEEARGEQLINEMNRRLRQVESTVARAPKRPRVLYYNSSGRTGGKDSVFGQIITRAGGINVAEEAGIASSAPISLEKIVELDPEIVIWDEYAPDDKPNWKHDFINHPALANVTAKKNNAFATIPAKHLNTAAQYIVFGVEDVAKVLHPDLFREDEGRRADGPPLMAGRGEESHA